MAGYEVVPSPNYPSPNYSQFGNEIGNLFGTFQQSQQNQNALQQQKMKLAQQQAIQNVAPTLPNGQPNYAGYLKALAGAGDVGAISMLGPLATEAQGGTVSPLFSGAQPAPGPAQQPAPGDLPPASAAAGSRTTPSVSVTDAPNITNAGALTGVPRQAPNQGAFGNLTGVSSTGLSVYGLAQQVIPDPAARAKGSELVEKILGVQPDQQLTAPQSARAQRILENFARGTGRAQPANGQYPDTQAGHAAFIRDRSVALGMAPNLPLGIAGAEGLRALSPSNPNSASAVDRNPDGTPFSFGDFQENVRNGLGTEARRAGIDPADPKQWQKADEFALEAMAKGGLGPWKGDAAVSAYQSQGGGWQVPRAGSAPPQGGGQGSGAIVPQPPLPSGARDAQSGVLMIDREIARLSASPNPGDRRQVEALQDWRNRIADASAPLTVSPTQTIVDSATGAIRYQGSLASGQGNMSPDAVRDAAQRYIDTGKLPPGLGRGIQGPANVNSILNEADRLMDRQGIAPEDLAAHQQAFNAQSAGQSLLSKRTASLELAENEAKALIPAVQQASKAVSRTQYPDLNKIIEAGLMHTGDTNVVRLGIAVESLAQTYARVLSPTGAPTAADKANAHDLLAKYWSAGQIDAALDQMNLEIARAKSSLNTTRKEMGAGALKEEDAPASGTSSAASGGGPRPGDVEQGYRFKGGDPSKKENWEKAN